MADFKVITPKRDIARELARKYSTMTHDELDVVEDILEPIKYGKGELILPEGEQCMGISYIEKGLVRQFYFKNGKEVTEHLGEVGLLIHIPYNPIYECTEEVTFTKLNDFLWSDALRSSALV